MKTEKTIYEITEDMVQMYSEQFFDRNLSKKELGYVRDRIYDSSTEIEMIICEKIQEAMDFNKLISRNKKADRDRAHYLVYSKNENVYCWEYVPVFITKTEQDARKYIGLQFQEPFQQWKITRKVGNTETEVAVIPSSPNEGAN